MPLYTQNTAAPVLHHRNDQVQQINSVTHGHSALPEDASGEYEFSRTGEVIEITLEDGVLSGYISLLGDQESDDGTPLTFFFDQVLARQRQISFTTRQIHGVWYAFDGTIGRGPGLARGDEGYYLLEGTMTIHDATRNMQTRRFVRLKSMPGCIEQAC